MSIDDPVEIARQQMIDEQLVKRGITDRRVLAAMAKIPRERFMPDLPPAEAYADRAWAIDCEQTISQPYIVARMSEALQLSGEEQVLEIGTGSGYQAAVLAELAGHVVTIERHRELSIVAARRLRELGYENVECVVGDGTLGWPERAPYDRMIVTAAAAEPPPALVEQLRDEGILVIPIGGPASQMLEAIRKHGDRLQPMGLTPCRFVPLIGAQAWPEA